METRAKHITVGAFVLSSVLAIAFFVFWLARFQGEAVYYDYYVRFFGSVSQLPIDSTVLFGGIPIGRVTDVRIDPDNSELARVDLAIRDGTPIRVDSRATLELQGIASSAILELNNAAKQFSALAAELQGAVGDARGDVTKAAHNFTLMAESFNKT